MSARRLSIAAETKKSAVEAIVKAETKETESRPAGMARAAVRGFAASNSRSAIRLKAIAAERAPTIAGVIQSACQTVGSPDALKPRAASTAPRKAKGSAKSVCSIFIISSVVRMLLAAVVISFGEVGKARAGRGRNSRRKLQDFYRARARTSRT